MLETMRFDIRVAKAKQQDLLHDVEKHRGFRNLKSGRKSGKRSTSKFGSFWIFAYGALKRLQSVAGEVIAPGHQGS